jgi:capsular exopolysaccharide synthesis family protein
MDLHDYLRVLRKRLWLIIPITLLFAATATTMSLATTPVYEASAKLLVVAKTDRAGGIASAYQGALLSQQLVKSFAQIMESRATAEAALRSTALGLTPRQLEGRIRAVPVPETLLIELAVEDADPVRARRLTNTVARAFIRTLPRLQGGSTLGVTLVEPALTPTVPVRPRTRLNIGLGTVIGLVLGVGLALLLDLLDRSIRTPEDLEAAIRAPVVGTIPPFKAGKQPIPVATEPRTAPAESFRKLRTNFAFLGIDRPSLCCVVTSATAGDGKSTVSANLGIALAQAGQRVVVVDADLRKPTLHRVFSLHQRVGTTTVLLDQANAADALQQPGPGMPFVLTSGQLPPNPSELLGSRRMQELLAELRATYEVVVVDCPPLLPVTDPMVVSGFADGILLVVKAGATTRDQVHAAQAICSKAGATVFGTVLNASRVAEGEQSAYYAYYGERSRSRPAEAGLDIVVPDVGGNNRENGSRAARHGRIHSSTR